MPGAVGHFLLMYNNYMKTANYDALIAQISAQEHAAQEAARELRTAAHDAREQRKVAAKAQVQVKTLQTVSLGIASGLGLTDIYALTCQTMVHQLLWDAAFVIAFTGDRAHILASYQATTKQLTHIQEYLPDTAAFLSAYSQRHPFSTYQATDQAALTLRALFQTDEIVGVPIHSGDQLYGYLIACAHTERTKRTALDTDFLPLLAEQLAHAAQNMGNMASLEEQNAKLRELDELKNSFISITSHQLRTPLSIIKWILSLLQNDKMITPLVEQKKLVDQAYVSNERLIHVVNDLLNVSRIQEGKLPYSPQLTDLRVVVEELVGEAKKIGESRNIRFEIDLDHPTPLLLADTLLLKEAVQNILDNAIDYNEDNGWVKVALQGKKDEVVLAVSNSGPGIPAEEQQKIFSQFYRSPEGMKMQPNGNGLGLYLTQAIAKRHGGNITCESKKDQTTFTLTLPLTPPEDT